MTERETIDKILNAKVASDLFPVTKAFEESKIAKTYHEYAKIVHPDICKEPEAQEAFLL